ncbi:transposase [Microcystis aeruginosa NIES-3807]|uniref:Transposase n=1 Tax=Microcystis aeruginosa NIES-3807 TaxID=2517785 RepID=A0AAD3GAW4_MICAE|nr:transposase [Microcystis aeruginosa NIES-3807]
MVKKERSCKCSQTETKIMLPELYLTCLQSQLTPAQFLTLEILVWLLQVHK